MAGVMDNFAFTAQLNAVLLKALDLSTPSDALSLRLPPAGLTLSNGTGTGQVSQMWHDTRNITASGTDSLDLAGGLTNAFGVTLTFVRLKFIYVLAHATNTNDVQVTRNATTGIPLFMADGDGIALAPGEFFIWGSPTTGKAVTATTDDTLLFTNSAGGTAVDFSVILVGTD